MPSLISLLNGMNDKPFPNASDEQSIPFRKVGTKELTTYKTFVKAVTNYSL